jgi:pentatricopeptide repeat domain-containing protein 1
MRTYNTLIIACNMSNRPHEALGVHQELLAEGFAPNSTTCNALISAYGKLGQLDKVLEVRRGPKKAGPLVLLKFSAPGG